MSEQQTAGASAPATPTCHDRPMLAVRNRSTENGLPYDEPIWWCADCHKALSRKKSAA